jgi:hypothetical protein
MPTDDGIAQTLIELSRNTHDDAESLEKDAVVQLLKQADEVEA